MKLMKILLVEGRKSDFVGKYSDKFDRREMSKIIRFSEALMKNHKFLNFLGQVLTPETMTDDNLNTIEGLLTRFERIKSNLDENNIDNINSVDELKQIIDSYDNRTRRKTDSRNDAHDIYEDEDVVVVSPLTHKSSCYYGAGTKWCTTTMNDDKYFKKYTDDGRLFYVISKTKSNKDNTYKIAIQKGFDGKNTYWNVKDEKITAEQTRIPEERLTKILDAVDSYLRRNFAKEIQIYQDEERKKEYLRQQKKQRMEELRARQNELRETNAWADNGLLDIATAVYNVITDDYEELIEEYNIVDPYSLFRIFDHQFGTDPETGAEFMVLDEDELREEAFRYFKDLFDDIGILEAIDRDFAMQHIDEDALRTYATELYTDYYMNEDASYILDPEDLQYDEYDQKKMDEIKREIRGLVSIVKDPDVDDETRENASMKIIDLESDLEDLEENAEYVLTDEQLDSLVSDRVEDIINRPYDFIDEIGGNIEDFLDEDELIQDIINADGYGFLASYDGAENETEVNGVNYYVFRVN